MAKIQYRESASHRSFREKLGAAGGSLRTLAQFEDGYGNCAEKVLVFRGDKPPIGAMTIDNEKDGYALYIVTPSNKIDDDISAIFAHD